jgi:release factor glutamine methyltransferase
VTSAGSVSEALSSAAAALEAAGVETPRLDAELMLAQATGRDRAWLVARPEADVEAPAAREFGAMVRRRVRREPVAYILGRRGFRRIDLEVDPRTLIPRPETELLVELALELGPRRVLDVGTGSGAIALAVADEVAEAEVTATDTSLEALAVARANRDRLGLADRVRFVLGSLPPAGESAFDLVLANLPYVAEREWGDLAPEIARFEPLEALIAGPTGLESIEGLLGALAIGELATAAVALEVGAGQAGDVAELVRRAGFERVEVRRDLAGIERAVVGRRDG